MRTLDELAASTADERLKRMISYVAVDPANAALRADAAEHALDAGEPAIAEALAGHGGQPDPRGLNLAGLAAMQLREFGRAAISFRRLVDEGVEDPAVRFNLAWSLAMEKEFEEALALLTPEVTRALPQAAMLEVQLLHELGQFERAADAGRRHIAAFPEHEGLAAAVSVLALDVEDVDLARQCAQKAPAHPDALATLGTLALGGQQLDQAEELFERALSINPSAPRAWIGLGLARLVTGDRRAAADIDRGAGLFGDHIGSWIAAGWAHVVAGDTGAARARFERALAIDGNFGESHGSLAVLDILDGRKAEAVKRMAVARRLDPQSFSAGFAQSLLAAHDGNPEQARRLVQKILETPVNDRGDTAAAALARLGLH